MTITEMERNWEFVTPSGLKLKGVDEDLRGHYVFPATVNEDICYGCRACKSVCENKNIKFDTKRGVVAINQIACKGCGSCVAICPSGALYQGFFCDKELFAEIDSALHIGSCEKCPVSAAVEFEAPRRSVRLVCSAHATTFVILGCFESGADGVMVLSCYFGYNVKMERGIAERGVEVAKLLLKTLGLNPERVCLKWISPLDPGFDKEVGEFVRRLQDGRDSWYYKSDEGILLR